MDLSANLPDREACIDAIYSLMEAVDGEDYPRLEDHYTPSAVLEISGFGRDPLVGRDAIMKHHIDGPTGKLDSLHQITNVRAAVDSAAGRAEMSGYGLCQHFPRGEGADHTKSRCFLTGLRYRWEMEKDGGKWRVSRMVVWGSWTMGDFGVVTETGV